MRRHFPIILIGFLLFVDSVFPAEVVNDVTQLNPIYVAKIITPTTVEEVRSAVAAHKGKISIGGGRYSMGGQTATEDALQLDMRKLNKVLNIDVLQKKVTVQAGARWRDIQEAIDPKNLSLKIMQSYSNFTVGGSLSVNCHGRYMGQGPLIRSVDSIKVVLAGGSLVIASPTQNPEIFYGVIGGYGGIGVIVEATLNLEDNVKVERVITTVPTNFYTKYFASDVREKNDIVFHNGDFSSNFEKVTVTNWVKTTKDLTVKNRLIPRNQKYWLQPTAIGLLTSIPGGKKLRPLLEDTKPKVVWRNYEASYDVAELEPASRASSTYVLQEYFLPVAKFDEFVPKMRKIFSESGANIVNVSIRHALPDPGSLLAWAREEVFSFVIYYKQGTSPAEREAVGDWTRQLVEAALSLGGTYYLPYQIHATDNQFQRAYPKHGEYFQLKKKLDPDYKFRNKLWDRYYESVEDQIAQYTATLKHYKRGEEQSFLTLPEWYIVFNTDEFAAYLKSGQRPSDFPYFASIVEYWSNYAKARKMTAGRYPFNRGYQLMLWVIGGSYSAELLVKGIYENTVGRLSQLVSSAEGTEEDRFIAKTYEEYGQFMHKDAWFNFSFWGKLKQFYRETGVWGANPLRKWERSAYFTADMLFKTAYGWLIGKLSGATYEPEEMEIVLVIQDGKTLPGALPDTKILLRAKGQSLLAVPRYDKFMHFISALSKNDARIIEIAGNRRIFLTAIGKKGLAKNITLAEVSGTSRVFPDGDKERMLLSSSVSGLTDLVRSLEANQITIEHIFDY